jgi:hypothetical protein
VFFRHVFPNSLLPTIGLLGIVVSLLIGGTVIVETVFNVPGMGQLMVRAVLLRDYFIVQGVTFFALGVVLHQFHRRHRHGRARPAGEAVSMDSAAAPSIAASSRLQLPATLLVGAAIVIVWILIALFGRTSLPTIP